MNCPFCGTTTSLSLRHCPQCGARLSQTPVLVAVATGSATAQLPPMPLSAAPAGTQPLPTGTLLQGRYVVERLLGAGSFGRVYLAEDRQGATGQWVAIKELFGAHFTTTTDRDEGIAWFKREVSTLLSLAHPSIPELYGYWVGGAADGPFYLAMEYIPGPTLEQALQQAGGQVDWTQAVAWGQALCEVLAYLHGSTPPFIFRDLKLANVILDSRTNSPVLIDFGIARQMSTGGGTAIGTWGYVPFEQILGRAEPRSDLYALGAMLHTLISGQQPDQEYQRLQRSGLSVEETLQALFPPLKTLDSQIPEILSDVVAMATAFEVEQRFADATEMANALAASLVPGSTLSMVRQTGQPATAVPPTAAPPAAQVLPKRRRVWSVRTVIQSTVIGILLFIAAGICIVASGLVGVSHPAQSVAPVAPTHAAAIPSMPSVSQPNHAAAPAEPLASSGVKNRYFASTKHNMEGNFLNFYETYGGLDTFGYPRTEVFVDSNSRFLQYTDRFLLSTIDVAIKVEPLGRLLTSNRHFAPIAPFHSTSTHLYFASTQHSLSGPFLDFWQKHHGSLLLGAPISEVVTESNSDGSGRSYPMQWFENGRLEYHFELANTRYAIEYGLVGKEYLEKLGWLP